MMSMRVAHLFVTLLFANVILARTNESAIRSLDYDEPDMVPYEESVPTEKPIFNYRRNGVRVDVRTVPVVNDSFEIDPEDRFPNFPIWDIGGCVIKLSLMCVGKSLTLYLDTIQSLDEITLFGHGVKLVRTKVSVSKMEDERMVTSNNVTDTIERSIDNFFDTFALRITLPGSSGTKERNQIDITLDETGLTQGRGKKGKGDKGGGGGKCKKMMMMMLMMVKMKVMGMIGMTAMKGMMMAGMSLMISKFMLIQKLMSLKKGGGGGGGGGGGPWQAGGGGGGGGQLKEIVLVTKASGGTGGGSGCCGGGGGAPMDSYGAPPSSSYGSPAGGSGGYDIGGGGGGGGWGRSFDDQSASVIHDKMRTTSNADQSDVARPATIPAVFIYNTAESRAITPNTNLSLISNFTGSRHNHSLHQEHRQHREVDQDPSSANKYPMNSLSESFWNNSTGERQISTFIHANNQTDQQQVRNIFSSNLISRWRANGTEKYFAESPRSTNSQRVI